MKPNFEARVTAGIFWGRILNRNVRRWWVTTGSWSICAVPPSVANAAASRRGNHEPPSGPDDPRLACGRSI